MWKELKARLETNTWDFSGAERLESTEIKKRGDVERRGHRINYCLRFKRGGGKCRDKSYRSL